MKEYKSENCYHIFPGATGPTGPSGSQEARIFAHKYNDKGNTI